MSSLYDANARYTDDASDLDVQVHQAMKPIFEKWIAFGYSPREISHVMMAAVWESEMIAVIR